MANKTLFCKRNIIFLLFSSVALLLSTSPGWAISACDCYLAGLSGYDKPDGCRTHSIGPMTPWLGGRYDGSRNNSDYGDSFGWCNDNGGGSSGSDYSSEGDFFDGLENSGGGGSSSGSSGGGTSWQPASGQWYAMPGAPHYGQGCAAGYFDDGANCWGGCEAGYFGVPNSPIGNVCIHCPDGTTSYRLQTDGQLECYQ